ncbi:MAG: thioredoxin domain-containing protein [Myxococcota bacterium]|nr:thioredoxin domain-containing protein [Myxococcota bacterium]
MRSQFRTLQRILYAGLLAGCAVLFSGLLAGCDGPGTSADPLAPVSADQDRAQRILANLKLRLPEIASANPEIGPLSPSEISGVDKGSFRIRGKDYPFLLTADDSKLYILQSEVIDVSLSEEEVRIELARLGEQKAREATERRVQLERATSGLPVRGNPEAPITIVEFSDFQCPYCSRGAETMEQVLERYPDQVRFVYKHFPLGFHPWAKPAAIAANCAAKQRADAFWTLHDGFFKNQKALTPGNLVSEGKRYLEGAGLDLAAWEKCASDPASEAYLAEARAVDADLEFGKSLGISGTPGFFVNGTFLNGALPFSAFEAIIEQAKGQQS